MSIEKLYHKKVRELKKLDKRQKRMERRRLKRIRADVHLVAERT
jgi:hypothetical protein